MVPDHDFTYWIARVAALCSAAFGAPLPYQMIQPWRDWFDLGYDPAHVIFELADPNPATYCSGAEFLIVLDPPSLFCKTGV